MVDIRQSTLFAKYLIKIGWQVERAAGINYFIRKLPLFGSILKLQRPEKIEIKTIKELAKIHKAFQVIVEPKTEPDAKFLLSVEFKLSKAPYLPTKTLLLDLTKSEKVILSNLEKDARSAIRKTKNIKGEEIKNIEEFRNAWKSSVGMKRYVPPITHLLALKTSFKENSYFSLSEDHSAGAIFLIGDKIAYYWQAFTNRAGRKNHYQYKIVWEGILWAKKMGAKIFDFEGIYDERFPNKSWLGFTHFKKSFGGDEVLYPGCYTRFRFLI